mgnify:CR=1 FL=1
MNYSVIVPAHNEAGFLPGLLDSLCSQDCLPNEVVLVNERYGVRLTSVIPTADRVKNL